MGKIKLCAWALSLALFASASAQAEVPKYVFENLSKCKTDPDFSEACKWYQESYGDWTDTEKAVLQTALKDADQNLPKAQPFFALLKSMGLKTIHFVHLMTGEDQALTVTHGSDPYIAFEPAFFASGVKFGEISSQEHVVLHELFHVWAGFRSIDDYFGDPLWRGLSSALEWTYAAGHTTMVNADQLNKAAKESNMLMHAQEWEQATEIDLGFSRPLGFPSFYSMTIISEYLPELGSFLIHDPEMQRTVPPTVVKFFRDRTNLGFLIDSGVSAESGPLVGRGDVNSANTEFVGMLFQEDTFLCTVFLLRDGVAATAKHCVDKSWSPLISRVGAQTYNYLSLVFIKADGSRVRVDGGAITGVHRDSGTDDLAYLVYEPSQTLGRIQVPQLNFVRTSEAMQNLQAPVFNVGYPLPQKVQRLQRMTSTACALDGQVGTLPDANYQGIFYGTGCPGWYGASGSPFLSEGNEGSYNLYGILSHTFDLGSDGQPANLKSDSWGPYTTSNFSPVYLGKEFLNVSVPLTN